MSEERPTRTVEVCEVVVCSFGHVHRIERGRETHVQEMADCGHWVGILDRFCGRCGREVGR